MKKNMKSIEILAPAGSLESLKSAISAGADAVYIGGSLFGARAFADNLDENDMCRAIDYVHLYNKKIYLTVNTLLKENELEENLYKYLKPYYECGLDAVIVQDLGVINRIHKEFKDLPIHASTQMTLTTAEGVNELKNYGVNRIVTSRELSFEEIKTMRSKTNLEIESFVHGALCFCYSGQCLLSSVIGGRSGNRGRCAQPCRMPYTIDGNKGYLLSPKDICTLEQIPNLIESGIDSFKIEGRMKRPEYSAMTAYLYRKYVEKYQTLTSEKYKEFAKNNLEKDIRDLKDLYNRGSFTSGYYFEHNGKDMMSMKRPNHNGVEVGEVVGVKGIKAKINLIEDINAQDILEIRGKNESDTYEFTVKEEHKKNKELITNFMPKCKIHANQQVFRTRNQKLLKEISDSYMKEMRKIVITGIFTAYENQHISLTLKYNDICISVVGEKVTPALKQPMSKEKIEKQILKTNDSPFVFSELDIYIDEGIFIPIVKINELRREALIKLEESIVKGYKKKSVENLAEKDKLNMKKDAYNNNGSVKYSVTIVNEEQLDVVLNYTDVERIYYDVCEGVSNLSLFSKKVRAKNKEFYVRLPHIFRENTRKEFVENKEKFKSLTDGYLIRNLEEYNYVKCELRADLEKVVTDYNLYTWNNSSKDFFADSGINENTTPVEFSLREFEDVIDNYTNVLVYGLIPVMVTAQCFCKNTKTCKKNEEILIMKDRKNEKYRIRNYCNYCYNTVYTDKPLNLLKNIEDIKGLKPYSFRLDFILESGKEVKKIMEEFLKK